MGQRHEFCIPLVFDFYNVPYLTPGIEMRIILEKNRINIPCQATNPNLQLKLKFHDLRLQYRRFNAPHSAPEVLNHFFKRKQYFPINRTSMRRRQINPGVLNTVIPALTTGQMPSKVMIAILSVDQLNNLDYDPFLYSTQNLREYQLLRNGSPVPQWPVSFENPETQYVRAYKYFTRQLGYHTQQIQVGPDMKEYVNSQFVMAWDINAGW